MINTKVYVTKPHKQNYNKNKINYLFAHGFILYEVVNLNEKSLTSAYKRFMQLKQNKNFKWDYSINHKAGYFDIFRARTRQMKEGIK